MTSRTPILVADGLWNCLCPSFSRRAIGSASRLPVRHPNSLPARRRQHDASYSPSAPLWSKTYRSNPNEIPNIKRSPLTIESAPPASAEEFARAQAASEERLLGQLDHFAQEANKPKVQELLIALVKDLGHVPDATHYEALLLAEADPEHGSAAEAERLLQQLDVDGIPPDSRIYHAALKALSVHPNYVLREHVLSLMEQRWYDLDEHGWHSVTAALIRERQIELALERLSQMQEVGYTPKPWLLHLAISTCLSIDAFPEALALLQQRHTLSKPVPSALWAECLTKAAQAFCHPLVDFVWRRAVEASYLNPSSGTCVAVLDTAARHGNFRLATDVFRVLGARASPLQLYHYEALMQAYLTAGDLPAVMSVLGLMARAKHVPDTGVCRALVQFLVEDAATRVPHCLALLAEPLPRVPFSPRSKSKSKSQSANNTFPIAGPVLSSCIEALVRVSAFDAAHSLWRDWTGYSPASPPPLAVYNVLLDGASKLTDSARARELAEEYLAAMEAHELVPNGVTLERMVLIQLGGASSGGSPKRPLEAETLLAALTSYERVQHLRRKRLPGKASLPGLPKATHHLLIKTLATAGQIQAAKAMGGNAWRSRLEGVSDEDIDAAAAEAKRKGMIVRLEHENHSRQWMI